LAKGIDYRSVFLYEIQSVNLTYNALEKYIMLIAFAPINYAAAMAIAVKKPVTIIFGFPSS